MITKINENPKKPNNSGPSFIQNPVEVLRNILLLCICLLSSLVVNGHTPEQSKAETMETSGSRWSVETSLTFPMVRIYMLKFSYKQSDRAELGFGPAFQNWKNTDESFIGQANAYTLVLSYRYYFWRNFNAEIEFWPAWNHFKSFEDGKTYKGPELWVEYKVGYRWDITQQFFLNFQPGIGHALWLQQDWPGVEKEPYGKFVRESVIFVPQVLVGWRF